jgi:hypothetical protein
MSNQSSSVIQPTAMPAQTAKPLPPGATSPMNAGIIKSQQQAQQQTALIGSGKTGGSRKKIKGGASVLVPAVPAGTIDAGATQANYSKITNLAQTGAANAVYDQSGSAAQTAQIAAQQQALYQSGGKKKSKKRRSKYMKRNHKKNKSKKSKKSKRKHNKK